MQAAIVYSRVEREANLPFMNAAAIWGAHRARCPKAQLKI